MNPEAKLLAEDTYIDMVHMFRRNHVKGCFQHDPGRIRSIIGQAICEAAIVWVDKGLHGDQREFSHWAYRFVQRRIIDEWRVAYGRTESTRRLDYSALRIDKEDHSGRDWHDRITDPEGQVDQDRIIQEMESEWFYEKIAPKLNERQVMYVKLRAEGMTQLEIGSVMGVSESRACQIGREVREKLQSMRNLFYN